MMSTFKKYWREAKVSTELFFGSGLGLGGVQRGCGLRGRKLQVEVVGRMEFGLIHEISTLSSYLPIKVMRYLYTLDFQYLAILFFNASCIK